jgi:hypothetical protein
MPRRAEIEDAEAPEAELPALPTRDPGIVGTAMTQLFNHPQGGLMHPRGRRPNHPQMPHIGDCLDVSCRRTTRADPRHLSVRAFRQPGSGKQATWTAIWI